MLFTCILRTSCLLVGRFATIKGRPLQLPSSRTLFGICCQFCFQSWSFQLPSDSCFLPQFCQSRSCQLQASLNLSLRRLSCRCTHFFFFPYLEQRVLTLEVIRCPTSLSRTLRGPASQRISVQAHKHSFQRRDHATRKNALAKAANSDP